jgi:hypothetical protein
MPQVEFMNEHTLTEWLAVCAKEPDLKEPMTISDHVGLLDRGGIVTVIGARESNVPEYWDNPRCVFMDGYDAVSRGLPQNARAVVFTRWVGHSSFKGIMKQVRKRRLTAFPVQGTGQLKRTLASLLHTNMTTKPEPTPDWSDADTRRRWNEAKAEAPAPEPRLSVQDEARESLLAGSGFTPEPPAPPDTPSPVESPDMTASKKKSSLPFRRGEVSAWVRSHYTPTLKFADLMRIANAENVTYKEATISAAFYALKRAQMTAAAPAKAPDAPSVNGSGTDELVRLVDDAIAGLTLVREAAVRAAADHEKMAEILKLARQLS